MGMANVTSPITSVSKNSAVNVNRYGCSPGKCHFFSLWHHTLLTSQSHLKEKLTLVIGSSLMPGGSLTGVNEKEEI